MDHWKKNSSLRYFAGLTLLMIPVMIMLFTAPAFARYRSGESEDIVFVPKEPAQICFVKIEGTTLSVIDSAEEFVWTRTEDGKMNLKLSVANGSRNDDYCKREQKVAVRLVTGLEILTEDIEENITLTYGEKVFKAKAEEIKAGSEYYNVSGAGWIITFVDEGGNEFSAALTGKELNHFDVTISVDESIIKDTVQMIPTAKVIG